MSEWGRRILKAFVGSDGGVRVTIPGTRAAKAKFTGPEGGLIEKYEMRDGKMEPVYAKDDVKVTGGKRDDRDPEIGTVIKREFKGVEHQVTFMGDAGWRWDTGEGGVYSTPSQIAKKIIGGPANGYLFFGLGVRHRTKAEAAADATTPAEPPPVVMPPEPEPPAAPPPAGPTDLKEPTPEHVRYFKALGADEFKAYLRNLDPYWQEYAFAARFGGSVADRQSKWASIDKLIAQDTRRAPLAEPPTPTPVPMKVPFQSRTVTRVEAPVHATTPGPAYPPPPAPAPAEAAKETVPTGGYISRTDDGRYSLHDAGGDKLGTYDTKDEAVAAAKPAEPAAPTPTAPTPEAPSVETPPAVETPAMVEAPVAEPTPTPTPAAEPKPKAAQFDPTKPESTMTVPGHGPMPAWRADRIPKGTVLAFPGGKNMTVVAAGRIPETGVIDFVLRNEATGGRARFASEDFKFLPVVRFPKGTLAEPKPAEAAASEPVPPKVRPPAPVTTGPMEARTANPGWTDPAPILKGMVGMTVKTRQRTSSGVFGAVVQTAEDGSKAVFKPRETEWKLKRPNISQKNLPGREAGFYEVSAALGISLVPPTTLATDAAHDGEPAREGSRQHFVGSDTGHRYRTAAETTVHPDELDPEEIAGFAFLDGLLGGEDRLDGNWMVSDEKIDGYRRIVLIDKGLSMGRFNLTARPIFHPDAINEGMRKPEAQAAYLRMCRDRLPKLADARAIVDKHMGDEANEVWTAIQIRAGEIAANAVVRKVTSAKTLASVTPHTNGEAKAAQMERGATETLTRNRISVLRAGAAPSTPAA